MERSKLEQLIAEKNERREYDTLRDAQTIIENIAAAQAKIKQQQELIVRLREDLAELSVETMDAKEVLGE